VADDPIGDPSVDPTAGDSWLGQQSAEVQQAIRSLRSENAKHRTTNKVLQSQISKLGDSASTIRKLSIDNHLLQKGTVDPKLARFYLSEEGQLDDIDVSAEDWTTLLDDRVNDLLGRHPELKGKAPMPTRSSTSGSTGGPGQPSMQLSRADAQMMTPEQVAAAFQSGHFDNLLGRKR